MPFLTIFCGSDQVSEISLCSFLSVLVLVILVFKLISVAKATFLIFIHVFRLILIYYFVSDLFQLPNNILIVVVLVNNSGGRGIQIKYLSKNTDITPVQLCHYNIITHFQFYLSKRTKVLDFNVLKGCILHPRCILIYFFRLMQLELY